MRTKRSSLPPRWKSGEPVTFKDERVFRQCGNLTENGQKFVPTGAQAFESVHAAWRDGSDNEMVDLCVDEFVRMARAKQEEPGAKPPDDGTPEPHDVQDVSEMPDRCTERVMH